MLALAENREPMKAQKETPDTMHGRLLEAVHISGYSTDRACKELAWLLDEDRWKNVGKGYEDIDDFLETINLSEFKITIEQRKTLSKRLSDLRATQRAAAKMLGVSHTTIQDDLRGGKKLPEPENEDQQKQDVSENGGKKLPKNVHVAENSGDNEWYTPPEYIEAARKVMGSIDLDPASSDIANRMVGAKQYFTKTNTGLNKPWVGNVFMNPPYASDLVKQFSSKFAREVGNIKRGIVLVNNATETAWFRELIDCASAVVFTSGRVRFLDPQGNPGAPLQGQAIIYSGDRPQVFLEEFKKFGWGAILQSD